MSSSSARSTLFCRPRRRQQGRLFGFIIIVLLVVFGTTTVARRRWMIVMQQAHSIPSSSSTTGAAPEIGISSSREKKRSDSADRWYTMYDNFSRMMLLWKQWVTSTSSSTALRLTSKNPNAPDKDDILPGVTVTRTMIHFPKHGNLTLDVDNDAIICSHRDVYGDNDCHWNWNATLGGTITALFDQPIQHGDYIEGHVKIDRFIPYQFRCAACGEDCNLSIPVIHANFTIPTAQDCPIPVETRTQRLVGQLWPDSPTGGLVTTSLQASIAMIQASTGKKLAEVKVEAWVK